MNEAKKVTMATQEQAFVVDQWVVEFINPEVGAAEFFKCQAENGAHAIEQAQSADPTCTIVDHWLD